METRKYRGAARVLIMDDEESMLEFCADIFERMGFEPVVAKDGREAIILFAGAAASGKPFAFTILDLSVPLGMGGIETAKAIRILDPEALVFAASGYWKEPAMAVPTAYGFTAKIEKPFKPEELAALVGKFIAAPIR
jgi:DNA-binding NtrC family response regulator